MKTTLHDVAARADVSIATASRALNGLAVSKENLARVRKAVAELGYVANEAARSLRSDRTMTMGLIFHDLKNMLGVELLDALSETIENAGYSLLISSARKSTERYETLMHRFLERRVDALFCIAPRGQSELLARYQNASIPLIVLFGGADAFAEQPSLAPSFTESGAAVAEHLSSLGHRRVVLLQHKQRARPFHAIEEALKSEGVAAQMIAPPEEGGMTEVVSRIQTSKPRPTAIIAPDPYARGLIAACASLGVRVPDELSIISVSEHAADARHKGVSALVVDPQHMGRAAGAAMLAWLAGTRPKERIKVQAGQFMARGTTGPAPR